MRLRILSANSDDKGTQLEQLTRRLLENLGHRNIVLNAIAPGGSELDVRADSPLPSFGDPHTVRLICECKAYDSPINTPDWLKFLGKVHTELARQPNRVRGVLIALSGANGNVMGACEELARQENTVELITGERLAAVASRVFALATAEQVTSHVRTLLSTPITELSLAYYSGVVYWLVSFSDSSFSVLHGINLNEAVGEQTIALARSEMGGARHRNLREEAEARSTVQWARQCILAYLLQQEGRSGTVQGIIDALRRLDANVPETVVRTAIEGLAQDEMIDAQTELRSIVRVVADIHFRVRVLRECTARSAPSRVLGTPEWMNLIDDALFSEILRIQGGVEMAGDDRTQCIQLLKWFPSALAWALRTDPVIQRHRAGQVVSPELNANDVRYFRAQLLERAVADFNNPAFSRILFERIGLREFEYARRAAFKSEERVELGVETLERFGIGRAAPELGGGIIRIWLHAEAPQPWEWPGRPAG